MQKYLNTLKKCPLFCGIGEGELLRMLECMGASVKNYEKRDTIVSQGSQAQSIGIMLSGTAHIECVDYLGNRNILSDISPSDMFCEEFACAGVKNVPINVVSTETADVMFVDCPHILHTCENNCEFHRRLIYNLVNSLAQSNLEYHQKWEITSKRTTREKLLEFLYQTSKRVGSDTFDIPYDRQELADYLEVERSGLSVEISRLKKEGVIANDRKRFTLL